MLLLLLSIGHSSASFFSLFPIVNVFEAGVRASIPCFRQPVLQPLSDSTVLAFATGRHKSGSSPTLCSDGGDGDRQFVVMRKSTDGGKTFGSLKVVPGPKTPDFYVSHFDAEKKEVCIVVQDGSESLLLRSSDEGETWEKTPFKLDTSGHIMQFSRISPAVGKMLSVGETWLAPMVCTVKNSTAPLTGDHGLCPLCRSCIALSTDKGRTWKLGAVAQSGSRESQLALGSRDDGIYISQRNMGTGNGHRMQSWSLDRGLTVSGSSVQEGLPEPVTANWTGVVGSVMSLPGLIVYSGPGSSVSRSNLTLFFSNNTGHRWTATEPILVHSGPSGYSDLAMLSAGTAGVLFENGDKGHTNSFAERISLARFLAHA